MTRPAGSVLLALVLAGCATARVPVSAPEAGGPPAPAAGIAAASAAPAAPASPPAGSGEAGPATAPVGAAPREAGASSSDRPASAPGGQAALVPRGEAATSAADPEPAPGPEPASRDERSAPAEESEPAAGREEPGPPVGEVVVWLEATPKVLAPGDAVSIVVRVSAPPPIGGVPFHLLFDAQRLAWERADEGPFLARGAETAFLAALVAPGRLAVGASRLGADQGVRGDGRLGTLIFRAIEAGPVDLAFDRASVRGPGGQPLASRFVGTRIIVTTPR